MLRSSCVTTLTRVAQLARGAATSSEGQQWKWLQDRGHVVNPCNSRSVLEYLPRKSALLSVAPSCSSTHGWPLQAHAARVCLPVLRLSIPIAIELPVAGCIRLLHQACSLKEKSCPCKQHTLQTATALAAVHHHSILFAMTNTLWQLHRLMPASVSAILQAPLQKMACI